MLQAPIDNGRQGWVVAGRERGENNENYIFGMESSRWQHVTGLVFNYLRDKFVT